MQEKVVLTNETGMHARPAGVFVQAANKFQCQVEIEAQGKKINGKSIMSIMSLGLQKGHEFTIYTDGPDASDALKTLVSLIHNQFQN